MRNSGGEDVDCHLPRYLVISALVLSDSSHMWLIRKRFGDLNSKSQQLTAKRRHQPKALYCCLSRTISRFSFSKHQYFCRKAVLAIHPQPIHSSPLSQISTQDEAGPILPPESQISLGCIILQAFEAVEERAKQSCIKRYSSLSTT